MSFEDRSLQCTDCSTTFTFSAEEQEIFKSRGYINDPKRCPDCRQVRKAQQYGSSYSYSNGNNSYRARREMFPAVCAECGKDTQVPFQPREDRPVYCNDCYSKVRANRSY